MDSVAGNHGRMTVDQFLAFAALEDERYELRDGVPIKMIGAFARNNRIQINLTSKLDALLGDGPCQVFSSGMCLKVGKYDLRLPLAAIYCEPCELAPANEDARYFSYPRVVFEIDPLSVPTDMLTRVIGYQKLKSVDTIVLIDSDSLQLTTWVRAEAENWTMTTHDRGAPLQLRDPRILLTADEIFRRVGGARPVEIPCVCD